MEKINDRWVNINTRIQWGSSQSLVGSACVAGAKRSTPYEVEIDFWVAIFLGLKLCML